MALPPQLRGLLWPLGNIIAMASLPAAPAAGHGASSSTPAADHFAGKPVADTLLDHVGVQLSTLPKLALAAALWAGSSWALGGAGWGAVGALPVEVFLRVAARDVALVWLLTGGWEFLLYSTYSPFAARLAGHKLNPVAPRDTQRTHDMFWSTVSTLLAAAFEVALMAAWARGAAPLPAGAAPGDAWWRGAGALATLGWCASMPYWRLAHFYCVHRVMCVLTRPPAAPRECEPNDPTLRARP